MNNTLRKKLISDFGSTFNNKETNFIKKILKSKKTLTRGKYVEIFENKLKKYIGCKYLLATSSGSSALELSSLALNLKKNDEVIVQSNSYWTAISHLLKIGVKIICCDIDKNLLIKKKHLKSLINKKTKAIYIFHHGGMLVNSNSLRNELSIPKRISIVEDCAHAIGSKLKNKHIGYNSDIACFSFSTQKNMSTLGEGGAITTNSSKIFKRLKLLKDSQCVSEELNLNKSLIDSKKLIKNQSFMPLGNNLKIKYKKLYNIGSNFRMSGIEAAVGICQLDKLKKNNIKRNKIAKIYDKILFKSKYCKKILTPKENYNSYHQYSFIIKNLNINQKEKLIKLLNKDGIFPKIRFSPINWYPAMRYYGCKIGGCIKCKKLENVEQTWLRELFNLPISPYLTEKDAKYIGKKFLECLNKLI